MLGRFGMAVHISKSIFQWILIVRGFWKSDADFECKTIVEKGIQEIVWQLWRGY